MKNLLTALFILFYLSLSAQSLSKEEKAIQQFKKYYNTQQHDSIYGLFSESFKAKFPPMALEALVGLVLNLNGKAESYELVKSENRKYTYLMSCERGAFEAMLAIDAKDFVGGFSLTPAQKKTSAPSKVFPSNNTGKTTLDKKMDVDVQKFLNGSECPGLSIAVVNGAATDYYNYGQTQSGVSNLPSENSVYDIGSITKTFTASLIVQLFERGKLKLTDSLGIFVAGLPPLISTIKIEQLLNHTSGLPSMPSPPKEVVPGRDAFEKYGHDNLLDDLRKIQLQSKPGEKFSYSNLGFATLGLVIEKITGKPFKSTLGEFIASARLSSTSVDPAMINKTNQTQGFARGQSVDYILLDAMAPAGILKSSASDMAKYAQLFFHKAGSPIPLVEKITFTDVNKIHIGLSWLIRDTAEGAVYFHNGGTVGYRSFIGIDPKSGKALIVLSNSATDVTSLGFSLMKHLY